MPSRCARYQVTALGKLFTLMCLCRCKWSSGWRRLVTFRLRFDSHYRSFASNLEQVANLLCAQANSASYPPWAVAVIAHKIWEGHGPMAIVVARAYNRGMGGSPQRGPGAEPLVMGSGGEASSKLKHFGFLDVQWKLQICPLLESLETQRHRICVLSLQKNHWWPRN